MHTHYLFEYAVIRIMPRVERGEFLNAGVILYCPKQQFLKAKYLLDKKKIAYLCGKTDIQELEDNLKIFERISNGSADAGPIAQLPIAERFRWLTATRSTIIQTSKVHPGFCTDAGEMLERLFEQLVV